MRRDNSKWQKKMDLEGESVQRRFETGPESHAEKDNLKREDFRSSTLLL